MITTKSKIRARRQLERKLRNGEPQEEVMKDFQRYMEIYPSRLFGEDWIEQFVEKYRRAYFPPERFR